MNRYFDFSDKQLKFLAVLCASVLIMSAWLWLSSYAERPPDAPTLSVYVGDDNHEYTGLFLIDPNVSPADSLELLPGIGPVLADRIVAYREEHHFKQPIDITDVRGIGPRVYERIKPYLRIRSR